MTLEQAIRVLTDLATEVGAGTPLVMDDGKPVTRFWVGSRAGGPPYQVHATDDPATAIGIGGRNPILTRAPRPA